MCVLKGFIYSRAHTRVQTPACVQWVDIRIILARCRGCKVHSSLPHFLSEAGSASPAFCLLVVARESPVDVENQVYTWVSQHGGPGRCGGGLLKSS